MSVFHRGRSGRKTGECAAIFVHAGAGYHSVQNESVHLKACNDAATAGMAVLRGGGSAVDAVEIAIKVLEDREITNAGYGSNLAIDGVVEGDAVIIDHLGRSGGCGAVAQVKNPISLARTILEQSTQELSLRRVPPNLLVGQGATDFAFEQGIPILPHDALVSPPARERWRRWKHELKNADKRASKVQTPNGIPLTKPTSPDPPPNYDDHVKSQLQRDHQTALNNSVWNEGQPISPAPTGHSSHGRIAPSALSTGSRGTSTTASPSTPATPATPTSDVEDARQRSSQPLTAENLARSALAQEVSQSTSSTEPASIQRAQDAARESDVVMADDQDNLQEGLSQMDDSDDFLAGNGWQDGASDDGSASDGTLKLPSMSPSPERSETSPHRGFDQDTINLPLRPQDDADLPFKHDEGHQDNITDTVGAIAIDNAGNIACGASSGGIGMKFRGRIGPAALVGVGAGVMPVDPEDRSKMCTGVVISGTGEHMGTTLAASVCADRLYHNQKRRKGGGFEYAEDDQSIRSMIEMDFMGHPSVKHSNSTGAIGVLAVKKSNHGVYLYFAHNTDSFALASMHSEEPKPTCTMSRSHGNGMLAQGGRSIRYKRRW